MTRTLRLVSFLSAAAVLAGYAANPFTDAANVAAAISAPAQATRPDPGERFYASLQALCGKAFPGRVVVDTPPAPDDPTWKGARDFVNQTLIMYVRKCGDDQIRIPFHVGADRSRTWVITRIKDAAGERRLRLKHDHRHKDGSNDALTMYGGDSIDAGTAGRQQFPLDSFSKALFVKFARPAAAATNVWTIELQPVTPSRMKSAASRAGRGSGWSSTSPSQLPLRRRRGAIRTEPCDKREGNGGNLPFRLKPSRLRAHPTVICLFSGTA